MRFALSVLSVLSVLACAEAPSEVRVPESSLESAARLGPDSFQNADCMADHLDEVRALQTQFLAEYQALRDRYLQLYRDAQADGASRRELRAIIAEANEVKEAFRADYQRALADLEAELCGVPVDPDPCVDDPYLEECCTYVDDAGECHRDFCSAYPDAEECQVWCDFPDDPACFCEYEPDHPDCHEPVDPCTDADPDREPPADGSDPDSGR